jgi:Flp pilus assembly protein TadG
MRDNVAPQRSTSRRGSTLVESALAMVVFAVLVAGIMEIALALFISNSIAFAAQRAARFASVRGSGSGHPASVADIQANARSYASPLATGDLAVTVTWTPDNTPGSTVLVKVSYNINSLMLPTTDGVLTLESKARQTIAQ